MAGPDELARIEQRFMQSVADRDMTYLDRHLAPEFSLTTGRPGHEIRSRAEWLHVTATDYLIERFSFEELDVIELGDAAIVRSRYRQAGTMGGSDRTQPFLMTDVWHRRNGEWMLVTRHITPLPAP